MTATVDTSVDPITRVHRGLVALLRSHETLRSLVLLRNWADFGAGDADIEVPGSTATDWPRLEIAPAGCSALIWRTSTSGEIVQRFRVALLTGQMDASRGLYPLTWAFVQALSRVNGDLGMPDIVKLVEVEGFEQGVSGGEDAKGTLQWVARATVAATLSVTKERMNERGSR